jgi:hypothetical protein
MWAVVRRTVDSNSVRYVEQFQPFNWGTDQNDCWFVDCGKAAITGLSHLNASTVSLFADGRPVEGTALTVSAGAVSPAPSGYTDTTVGLPYTSILETMPLWVDTQSGDSLGRNTRVLQVTADFYKTLGAHVGSSANYAANLKFSDDAFATTMALFTGTKTIPYTRGQSRSASIYLTESSPVPLTLRAYTADLEVTFE